MYRIRQFKILLVGCVVAMCLTTSHASAIAVIDQNTGLIDPDAVVDFGFELFPTNTVITDQFAAQGVTFGSNYRYLSTNPGFGGAAVILGHLGSANAALQPGPIFFASDVTDAIFSWRTNTGTTTFEAYLNGNLVETFMAASDGAFNPRKFHGFSGIVFDEIRLEVDAGNAAFSLDTLQYNVSEIPLPPALPLFLAALSALVLHGWRRRRAIRAA